MFAAVCLATLLFALLTPPFQAPDENQHYLKAVLLSQGRLVAEVRQGEAGAELPRDAVELRTTDFPAAAPGVPARGSFEALRRAWRADAGRAGTRFAPFPNLANYSPTLYVPQAAGIAAAEAAGLPRLGGFYAGRLLNALTALGLLLLALHIVPFGRPALLAVAAVPTFAFQSGSLSADALIVGLGFVATALSLRLGHTAQRKAAVRSYLIAAPFLGLAKGVYLPLLLAGLRPSRALAERRTLVFAAAAALAAGCFALWMAHSGGPALYGIVSRKTGQAAMTAPLDSQLRVILASPFRYVHVLFSSMAERSPVYLLQIVGRFGWNAILLPLLAYPLAGLMIVCALLGGGGPRARLPERIWWLLLAGAGAVLVETALYLTGTPYAADYIQGTQGRYFLPLMPLALTALMPQAPRPRSAVRARAVFAVSALLLAGIGLASALDSFWVTGFVTADGLPPVQKNASGIARALLLPSPRW